MKILGIETSCDETAAAVVRRDGDGRGEILSNVVRSQWDAHRAYGGVVPEIAARAHTDCIIEIISQALKDASLNLSDLDGIAATAGPGLIGGLLVGLTTGKALAHARGLPLVGVNHLAAHALTVGLTDDLRPPYLLLLVSGGHTQTVLVHAVGQYQRIGSTIDDALGEAFDKTAKLMGLGFPGGPAVEACARDGVSTRFSFPRPMMGRDDANFSFAGLKTAVRRQAQALAPLTKPDIADICASFEAAVCDSIADRLNRAYKIAGAALDEAAQTHTENADDADDDDGARSTAGAAPLPLVAAGGVAANQRLRACLQVVADAHNARLVVPPVQFCSDNGAMIAWAGAEQLASPHEAASGDAPAVGPNEMPWALPARARWPLDETAIPILGTGKQGAKA